MVSPRAHRSGTFALTVQALCDAGNTWERMGRIINRNTRMFTRTAPGRDAEFVATRGHLLDVARLKHVASDLGITLVTLSRIRCGSY